MEAIQKIILQLENDLLKSEVRKSPQKLSELLSEDFIEFTSSGIEYHYKSGEVFQKQDDNSELLWQVTDFKIKQLSDDCILATYKVVKHNEPNENNKYSIRSSIWKSYSGKWKMLFHQGTPTSQI